jgi:ribosome biogenesis GTPase
LATAFDAGVLSAFGWTDRVLALFNEVAGPALEPARVIRVERSACAAVFTDGSERLVHAPVLPVVGDWIAVRHDSIDAVLRRWSGLARADPSGGAVQMLAANIDLVVITAPADRLSPSRVERELTVAWDSGAQPVVVLTKSDLAGGDAWEHLAQRLVGVDVIATSASTGRGVQELRERLRPGRTAVLLGPSGAGKSTLANALIGHDVLATAAVRDRDHRGRHTTTSRQLITVPGGGVLIDTPGLRSLALPGDVPVEAAFPDIGSLSASCRFSDCRHETEPGCAVVAAVTSGGLDHDRLKSFRKLQREAAAEARRSDPLLRRAELSVWKSRSKAARLNNKRQR